MLDMEYNYKPNSKHNTYYHKENSLEQIDIFKHSII